MRWAFVGAIVVVATYASSVTESHAQSATDDFYSKDYAKTGGLRQDRAKVLEDGSPAVPEASGQPQQAPQTGSASVVRPEDDELEDPDRPTVSLYVNSLDKKHFESVLNEVVALRQVKKSRITSLTHIGDYRNISPEIKDQLTKLDITLKGGSQLPEDLKDSQSPVWIIQSAEGRYILDGVMDIGRYVDSDGKFSETASAGPTPTPGAKMAGF